jgi:hypothetical protein
MKWRVSTSKEFLEGGPFFPRPHLKSVEPQVDLYDWEQEETDQDVG